MKYSQVLAKWLKKNNYTHFFTVGGGNIMHLTNSFNNELKCIPFIHEVGAGIAAEYFNETSLNHKALVLVTAGPGITNLVTSIAGSYLESRELLIIAGQVKTSDLKMKSQRQSGIQEIDGVEITKSITKKSYLMSTPIAEDAFNDLIRDSFNDRKGPVYIEIPIDVQGIDIKKETILKKGYSRIDQQKNFFDKSLALSMLKKSQNPVLLLGGGVSREFVKKHYSTFKKINIPIMTTWNGMDRYSSHENNYFGRPNTWGMRYSNIIIQKSDLVIAVGTRLGLQQTGFNWKEFVPEGRIMHVDIDQQELDKKNPKTDLKINIDSSLFLEWLLKYIPAYDKSWIDRAIKIKRLFPVIEKNQTGYGYVSPYLLIDSISKLSNHNDVIIPCSSGGAFTVTMQAFMQKRNQTIVSNKGLASMGYGLSGSIGAAIANKKKRVVLFEGDGGFAQNIQELGTLIINNLNIKIFIFSDEGYASIRATQKNYFKGNYVGCDLKTGVGLPNLKKIAEAYKIKYMKIKTLNFNQSFYSTFNSSSPIIYEVSVDPNQTYYPKISSKVNDDGSIVSNPLHKMSPEMDIDINDL